MARSRRLAYARLAFVLALSVLAIGNMVLLLVLHPTSPWLWLPTVGVIWLGGTTVLVLATTPAAIIVEATVYHIIIPRPMPRCLYKCRRFHPRRSRKSRRFTAEFVRG